MGGFSAGIWGKPFGGIHTFVKSLKFIHITKTAGTSIVESGFRAGLHWGWRHKEYGWWHGCFPLKPSRLKESHEWFAVVRDPYERLVSEFHCPHAIEEEADWEARDQNEKAIESGDVNMFNKALRRRIRSRDLSGRHYTEQFRYFEDSTPVRVLRFENLLQEFSMLMRDYSLEASLQEIPERMRRSFGVEDMDESTLRLVNDVYRKDFLTLGYKMKKTKPIFC